MYWQKHALKVQCVESCSVLMMQMLQNLNTTSMSPFSITVQSNGNKCVFRTYNSPFFNQNAENDKKNDSKVQRKNPLYSNSCSEEAAFNTPSWLNCCKETTTKEEKQEDCLGQETQRTYMTPVEIYT